MSEEERKQKNEIIDALSLMYEERVDELFGKEEARTPVFQEDINMAWCYQHKRQCVCWSARERVPQEKLCLAIAGSPCTDWSRYGLGKKFTGRTAKVFFSWVKQRRALQEDIVVHENVLNFPSSTLARQLGESHVLFPSLQCPSFYGQPTTGVRSHVIAVRKHSGHLAEPLNNASYRLFHKSVQLTADVYFTYSREEVKATIGGEALEQEDMRAGDFARLQVHASKAIRRGRRDLVTAGYVNVTQSSARASLSTSMPRPTASASKLFSTAVGRCLAPVEHMLVQLVPVRDGLCAHSLPWKHLIERGNPEALSARHIVRLAGNTMNVQVVGIQICWALGLFQTHNPHPLSWPHRPASVSGSVDGSDEDDEE